MTIQMGNEMNEMTKADAVRKVYGLNTSLQSSEIVSILEVLGLITFREAVFEIISPDRRIHCKIWDNGEIEGFPDGCQIINRLHQLK